MSLTRLGNSLSLSLSLVHPSLHPRPIPSMSLFWWCLGPGIAFAWAIVGGDAPVHHTKGKLHIKNSEQQASSMYASGGISRRAFKLWTCVLVTVYARMYLSMLCARVCILCMCSLYFITCILYIAWLRLPKETKQWRVCRATSS